MINCRKEHAHRDGLAERPLGMLSSGAQQVLEEEDGEADELESEGAKHVDALEGLIC